MKTRQTLVSNSSSTSFIIRGIKIDTKELCKILQINEFNFRVIEDIFIIKKCKLDIKPCKNWFNLDEKYEDVILGLNSNKSFEDGELVEIGPQDDIDPKVKEELKKIGLDNMQLATWVQYVSNDNC